MIWYLVAFLAGMFLGAYLANKTFKERVHKETKKIWHGLEKLSGTNKKEAK